MGALALFALITLMVGAAVGQERSYGDRGDGGRCNGGGGGGGGDFSGGDFGGSFGTLSVVGLTADQRLICFDENAPGNASNIGTVSGLITDTRLVGIDFRPATGNDGDGGDLYGLGNAGGVYTINVDTAQATLRSRLNVALSGNFFGVDFNPVVDRLRVTSDNGQNLRANVDTGATIVDGTLNYAPSVTANGIAGSAYTNNDADPNTATTLYAADSLLDQIAIQAPPNAGTLNATGKLTVDTTPVIGFDIYSTIRNNSTVDIRGLASLTTGGQARFYRITLFTGKAALRGTFSSQNQVTGIAIPLNQL
ncbi:MAG: DUF4394 domain-containing protein [Pyrinomonadaceae bacterium]